MTQAMRSFRCSETHRGRAFLSKMSQYDISFVFDQIKYDGGVDEADFLDLEVELKRFFFLVAFRREALAMISPLVDRVWHQFIMFTEEYANFCQKNLGFFVHHRPDTVATPVPIEAGENFLRAYEIEFGNLPPIWWKGMRPETETFYQSRPLRGRPPVRWSGWTGEVVSRR